MKVSDLARHLNDLRQMLGAAGAKGAILTDLAAIAEGLRPFGEHSLSDFANFLVRAEAFSRGEVPVVPPKKTKTTKQRKPKAPPPDSAALAQEAKRLYDHASEPTVTLEMVDDLIARASKLKQDGMVAVALAIELRFSGKPKKATIAAQIKKRILDRKGSYQRAGLLDRPTSEPEPVTQ